MSAILAGLGAALALAACGNDENITDGPIAFDSPTADGPPTIDAGPADARIDAMPMIDAVPTTVTVVAGACPGMPDHDMSTATLAFTYNGGVPPSPIVVGVGETLEFTTVAGHNFANATGPTGQFGFRSGSTAAGHTACLTFTLATPAAIQYVCEAHLGIMMGTLDVN